MSAEDGAGAHAADNPGRRTLSLLPRRRRSRRRPVVDRPRERRADSADVAWRVGLTLFTVALWLAALVEVIADPELHRWWWYGLLGLAKVGWLAMAWGAYLSVLSWNRARWGRGL